MRENMKSLIEHLQKCQELLGLEKSVNPLVGSSNTGVQNIVYKQKTGHTSSVGKQTKQPVGIPAIPELKPIVTPGTKHLRLGGNKIANMEA
jgi:hypothetical protein